jgi:hypothetical protein
MCSKKPGAAVEQTTEALALMGKSFEGIESKGVERWLSVDSYYNSIRPHAGNQNWSLQVTVNFLFPHD